MKILVTGGSGFIGSHVVDKLKDKGVFVRIFDGVMPTFRKDIEYYQGSILDITALGFAMEDIDAVIHLAAVADVKDVFNPNIVKVVIDQKGYALYFSRSPIPYINTNVKNIEEGMVFYKHIGIYAFRKKFLDMYSKLNKSSLEVTEKLEQLRIIENGYKIMTVKTVYDSPSVDIKEDIENISSTCKQ